jgi:large subunit ribosomal protein L35
MPKMKTKSSAKKRFRVSSTGKVKSKQAFMRHMQMNKPKSMKRKAKGQGILSVPDAKIILNNWLPYARKKQSPKTRRVDVSAQGGA